MSSFEPLFSQPGRTRITPRVSVPVSATTQWMPAALERRTVAPVSFFDDFDVDHRMVEQASVIAQQELAQREAAAEAAREAARQAAIDAAYLRGMSEGREQGELAERARLRGAMMASESALDDLRSNEARWLANLEENIAAIAVGVAQQIVAREVTLSTDTVTTMVARAVQEFGLDQPLTIRVNPGDLESLQSVERTAPDDVAGLTTGREVRWVHDARIEPGGCVVEGRERIVDGRVDTGLERLYRRLTYTNA